MKKARLVAVILGMSVGMIMVAQPAKAAQEPWESGGTVASAPVIAGVFDPLDMCPVTTQAMVVQGFRDSQQVCPYLKTASEAVGTVGTRVSVVHFGQNTTGYRLMNCDPSVCLYDVPQDVVITKQRVNTAIYSSLVIYKNASKRLTPILSATGLDGYSFDFSNPDYVAWTSGGPPVYVGAMTLSMNGAWLAMEFINQGFGVMDLTTLSMKRVSAIPFSYGYGIDPSINVAISNDGTALAVTGQNAADFIIHITPGCGQDALMTPFVTIPSCVVTFIDSMLANIQNGFTYASRPSLNDDGTALWLAVKYWPNTIRLVTVKTSSVSASRLDYLGMGDSYTSGEGEVDDARYLIGTNNPQGKCHTSNRSYPFLVASLDSVTSVQNIACSGARIADIENDTSSYRGQGNRLDESLGLSPNMISARQQTALASFLPGEAPQASFVERYQPRVIMIGIGGNDVGFMDKMRACVMPDECEWTTPNGKVQSREEIAALEPKLIRLYQDLKRRSPDSKLFAVDYPQIINSEGTCSGITNLLLSFNERQFVTESINYINQVIKEAAIKAGIYFVDVENAYAGYRLCDGSASPAVNALQVGDDVAPINQLSVVKLIGDETFHPTPFGHQLVATSIHQQVGKLTDAPPCTPCPPFVAVPPIGWGSAVPPAQAVATPLTSVTSFQVSSPLFTVSLYPRALQPGTVARVEIHSQDMSSFSQVVSDDGSIVLKTSLPATLAAGYHTVHVHGTSFTGSLVDYYQTFLVTDDAPLQVPITKSDVSKTTSLNMTNILQAPNKMTSQTGFAAGGLKGVEMEKPVGRSQAPMSYSDRRKWELITVSIICLFTGIIIVAVILWRRK